MLPGRWHYSALFVILFFVRYLRTVVHAIVFYICIKPCHRGKSFYNTEDVTVVLPSILGDDILPCLRSIVANRPNRILLIIDRNKVVYMSRICDEQGFTNIRVLGVDEMGKRTQMVTGIKQVKTPIIAFADDDVEWHPDYLSYLLTPFKNPSVGAVGTEQRAIRASKPNIWNILGICYLERRNFNNMAPNYIDGAVSTLSGRTAAYRTEILKNDEFYDFFVEDTFGGKRIKTGDDKRLTLATFRKGWKIGLIYTKEAALFTKLNGGIDYVNQCVRWARSHWQGNLAVVGTQTYWWRQHPWSAYAIYFGSLMTPALLVDGGLWIILRRALQGLDVSTWNQRLMLGGFVAWTLMAKTIKVLGHFRRHPADIKFLPAVIIFSYLHGLINLYAAFTMRCNKWHGRRIIDSSEWNEQKAI